MLSFSRYCRFPLRIVPMPLLIVFVDVLGNCSHQCIFILLFINASSLVLSREIRCLMMLRLLIMNLHIACCLEFYRFVCWSCYHSVCIYGILLFWIHYTCICFLWCFKGFCIAFRPVDTLRHSCSIGDPQISGWLYFKSMRLFYYYFTLEPSVNACVTMEIFTLKSVIYAVSVHVTDIFCHFFSGVIYSCLK